MGIATLDHESTVERSLASHIRTQALRDLAIDLLALYEKEPMGEGLYAFVLSSSALNVLEELLICSEEFWKEQAQEVENRMEQEASELTVPPFREGIAGHDHNSWKEFWLTSDQASTAKSKLLRENLADLESIYQKLLIALKWPTQNELDEGMHKLSKLQEEILIYTLDLRSHSTGLTEWSPEDWFGTPEKEEAESKRVAWSRAAQRLENRGLIGRHAPQRTTTHIRLTNLGIAVAKRLRRNIVA